MALDFNRAVVGWTAHLTKDEADRLTAAEIESVRTFAEVCPVFAMACPEGWFFWVDEDWGEMEGQDAETWPGLDALQRWAAEYNGAQAEPYRVQWIRLDCDAEAIEGVPSYEW